MLLAGGGGGGPADGDGLGICLRGRLVGCFGGRRGGATAVGGTWCSRVFSFVWRGEELLGGARLGGGGGAAVGVLSP